MNPARNAYELVRDNKLTTCKRCGETNLAWVQLKSGKWALVATCYKRPVYSGQNKHPEAPQGYVYANKLNFHHCGEIRVLRVLADLEVSKAECYRAYTGNGAQAVIDACAVDPTAFAEAIRKLESVFRYAGQQVSEWNK